MRIQVTQLKNTSEKDESLLLVKSLSRQIFLYLNTYYYFYPYPANEIGIAIKVAMENIPACTSIKYYDTCIAGIEDKAITSLEENDSRVFGRNGLQIGNRFCYELMIETDTATCDRKPMSGTYASCIVNYNDPDINGGWNYLYNEWLPNSMFEQASEEYFEEYLFRDGLPYKLKLYLPVQKRKAQHHLSILELSEMTFVVAR